jgi:NRPS condensation-like uncharacterized protein
VSAAVDWLTTCLVASRPWDDEASTSEVHDWFMTLTGPTVARVPLNRLDELFLVLDHGDEPWNVHFEVRPHDRLDAERLVGAIRIAALRHPLARARLADWRYTDRGHRWEIADALVDVALRTVDADDDTAVAAAREQLLGCSPALDTPPPFLVLLAHGPAADALVLNLHHAAGDGVAAMRLMLSILRAYAGVDDPSPALDLVTVRDVNALAGAASFAERLVRLRALAASAGRLPGPRARVGIEGGQKRPGYGVALLVLSPEETAAVRARRTEGTTVNDVLLAALAVTIRSWNAAHGEPPRRVTLSMPVNLRPPAWRTEVVSNFASYVSLSGTDADDFPAALECISRETRSVKREGLAGLVVDLLAGFSVLTIAAKRMLPDIIDLTSGLVVDTASLSNLGILPDLGVDAVWFSPPGRMPLGVAVGAATHNGRLHLAVRYRHAQFGVTAGAAFAKLYREMLLPG